MTNKYIERSRKLIPFGSLVVLLSFFSCSEIAVNTVIDTIVSPSGKDAVYIFSRDAGATTEFSTQVSILPAGSMDRLSTGNVFVVDSDHGKVQDLFPEGGPRVSARWDSENHVTILVSRDARVFKEESMVQGVKVAYGRL